MRLARLLAFVAGSAAGLVGMGLARAEFDLVPKQLVVQDLPVTAQIVNRGSRAEYVSISLAQLLNPGVDFADEKVEPVGEALQPALYVSPFRVTLGPGQTKVITLKPVRPVDTERVYRLDVRPVVKMQRDNRQGMAGSVVVNLAFKGLVRQLPGIERATVAVTCDETGAHVVATGTVRYTVSGAMADGRMLDDFNVYPGVPRTLTGRVVTIPGQPSCEIKS